MALHPKAKRRLLILTAGAIIAAIGISLAYVARQQQLDRRAIAARDEGIVLLEQGDYFDALHKLGTYVSRHQHDAGVLYQYALARQNVPAPNDKHIGDAMGLYRRVLSLEPSHAEAATNLLELYEQAGFTTEALALSERVLKQRPTDPAALAVRGRTFIRNREYGRAEEAALEWARVTEGEIDPHLLVLDVLRRQPGAAAKVEAYIDEQREEHPEAGFVEILGIQAQLMADDVEGARESARAAATRPLENARNAEVLVGLLEGLDLPDEALAVLEREASTQSPELLLKLAQVRFERGATETLLSMEADGVDADSDGIRVFQILALVRDGRTDEARNALSILKNREGNSSSFTEAWITVLDEHTAADGNPGDLIKAARNAEGALRRDARLHHLMGIALAELGEPDAALQSLVDAAQRAPHWAEPLGAAIEVSVSQGRIGDAEGAAKGVLRLEPEDPDALYAVSLAAVIRARDSDSATVELAEKAIEALQQAEPGDRHLPLLVRLRSDAGRTDEAIELIAEGIAAGAEISTQALFDLAELSRTRSLGLDQEILGVMETRKDAAARLAQVKAQHRVADEDVDGALQITEAAIGKAEGADLRELETFRARLLGMAGRPEAKEAWTSLAEKYADDAKIQWTALAAPSVTGDRKGSGAILARLKEQVGEQSTTWRLARAQWLLLDQENKNAAVDAAQLLAQLAQEPTRTSRTHLLFAEALRRLDNRAGAAEQLALAAELEPGNAAIALDLAQARRAEGDMSGAREQLGAVLDNPEASAEQRRRAATLSASLGDPGRALAALARDVEEGEKVPALLLASLYRQTNQPAMVDQVVEQMAASKDPAEVAFVADWQWERDRREASDEALATLRELDTQPGTRPMLIGGLMHRRGDMDAAEKEYRTATGIDPADPEPWQQLVRFAIAERPLSAAQDIAAEAVANAGTDAMLLRAEALLEKGQAVAREQAAFVDDLILGELSSPGSGGEEMLELLSKAGASIGADELRAARTLAEAHPQSLPVQYVASSLHLQVGDADQAAAIASRAMEANSSDPHTARLAANAFAAAGRWDEVLAVSREWRAREPSAVLEIDRLVAAANMELGNPTNAFHSLEPYLELARSQPEKYGDILAEVAVSRALMGDTDDAFALLRPLLATGATARNTWAVIAGQLIEDKAVAVSALDELASAVSAEDASARVVVAEARTALAGRYSDDEEIEAHAKEALNVASELAAEANQPYLHLSIGSMYEVLQEPEFAEVHYRATLKLAPDEPIAQNNLAMVLLAQDRFDEALSLSQAAARTEHPNRVDFLETLAQIQIAQKQYEPAIQTLHRAIALSPRNFPVQLRLAEALIQAGQPADAKAVLDDANLLRNEASEDGKQRFDELLERVASIR